MYPTIYGLHLTLFESLLGRTYICENSKFAQTDLARVYSRSSSFFSSQAPSVSFMIDKTFCVSSAAPRRNQETLHTMGDIIEKVPISCTSLDIPTNSRPNYLLEPNMVRFFFP
jgi:hypothetical protein